MNATYRRSRAVRLSSHDYVTDHPIHLIICADAGTPFHDPTLAREVCQSVEYVARKLEFDLHAYCLMPDHLHVLLSPAASQTPVSEFLRQMKSFTTRRYQQLFNRTKLWQRSARDRVLRACEPADRIAAYIANNPVRKGLVDDWQVWPYTKVEIA